MDRIAIRTSLRVMFPMISFKAASDVLYHDDLMLASIPVGGIGPHLDIAFRIRIQERRSMLVESDIDPFRNMHVEVKGHRIDDLSLRMQQRHGKKKRKDEHRPQSAVDDAPALVTAFPLHQTAVTVRVMSAL